MEYDNFSQICTSATSIVIGDLERHMGTPVSVAVVNENEYALLTTEGLFSVSRAEWDINEPAKHRPWKLRAILTIPLDEEGE